MEEKPSPRPRPEGVTDETVQAIGRLTHAMETVIRARGYLYGFHELTGRADNELDEVVELFRTAGHEQFAATIERELLGRNVIDRHWTFQIVDDYDENYFDLFVSLERRAREELADGVKHLREAEMKRDRTTSGKPGHELL
ncbi:hypothetical protein Kfla_6178 [Kribbella flavida DSM 17836]|uniref:Uncharacterized protein n=1 Tax=Kribbella flavida (strain DSM 17836 / JCM 10339 / NBRC 14399) TaxID=479435 RepID=D2PUD0_KRIFD|nr:hypothetical protein [Kribbella flavida]ADB35181.1 hypothetical protein Kfla_6178 [Kribbella flavida DSM 17836]